jgi:hypothetical protein
MINTTKVMMLFTWRRRLAEAGADLVAVNRIITALTN